MSSSFLNRISAASASAAKLIAEAKTAAQLAGERVRADRTSATTSDIDRSNHSVTSSSDVETSHKIAPQPSDSVFDSEASNNALASSIDGKETKVNGPSDDDDKGETIALLLAALSNKESDGCGAIL